MKRISILLTILLTSTKLISAQEIRSNERGINPGMGNIQKQDLIFRPFTTGNWSALNGQEEYEHRAKINPEAGIRFGQPPLLVSEAFSCYSKVNGYDKYPDNHTKIIEIIP